MLSHQEFLDECARGHAEYRAKRQYLVSPFLRRSSPGARLIGFSYRLLRAA